MPRKALTDRGLKALKAAPKGKRLDHMDSVVPGFGVRVTDKGQRTFILITRYPGAKNPTRRALGEVGAITLEKAREKARAWLELIQRGKDPGAEEERQRLAEQQRRANTFAAVAEDFIREKVLGPKCYSEWKALEWASPPQHKPLERKGLEVARDIRRDLMPAWRSRPITEITDIDIIGLVKRKRASAPAQARNLLGLIKRFFAWAVDQRLYGLAGSPAETIKPNRIIGEKVTGTRILSDTELFALWRAATRMPYPHGPVYQLLMLTALRLNEAADAEKREFDFEERVWIIPAERMKGRDGKARPHAVPLTDDMLQVIGMLPDFKKGDYQFSTTFGESPVWMSDKVKRRLDERMLRTLRALARKRGDDPAGVKLEHWVNHDIRRTVRSNLSRLKVTEEAREAVLAHARPGIKGVYDQHDYLDEKFEALDLWGARLRAIVESTRRRR